MTRSLAVLLALSASFAASSDGLDAFKDVLRYGTEAQQGDALERIRRSGFPVSNRGLWEQALELAVPLLDANGVARSFLALVGDQKLSRYSGHFEAVLSKRDARGEDCRPEDLATMAEAMKQIAILSNASQGRLVASYATNSLRHRRHPGLWGESLRAVEALTPEGLPPALRQIAEDEGTPEGAAAAAVRALAAYKRPEDVTWLGAFARNEAQKSLGRWQAAAVLGAFAPDPKAREEATRLFEGNDIEIRLRALYSLSFFPGEDLRKLVFQASRDNSVRVRQSALSAMARYADDESANILKWKQKFDPEKPVRDEAEKSLRTRGLWTTNR